MSSEPNKNLMRRVERAAAVLLDREGRFTYPSLLQDLGMLAPRDLEARADGTGVLDGSPMIGRRVLRRPVDLDQ